MSRTKTQLINYLKQIDLKADRVLSIGSQDDDRRYFKSVDVKEWKTLDYNREFNPDYYVDMNYPLIGGENFGEFDFILAFELWEYIWNPYQAHKTIFQMLKSGGTYMGAYAFIYPHHNPPGTDFLRYTDWGIKKFLETCRFKDIKTTERVATEGKSNLQEFVYKEGMKLSKSLMGNYNWPIGYIVEAKKNEK